MNYFYTISRGDQASNDIAKQIQLKLELNNYVLNKDLATNIFVVGGDGTFLEAIHTFVSKLNEVKFIGIHTGTLGFIADCEKDEFDIMLDEFLQNKQRIFNYPLIEAVYEDKTVYAFNEIRIENNVRTLLVDVAINDTYFETFRGSGLCLSTQIGSTAYNRSIGGAVVEHGLNVLQLSEIAGIHHKAYQSLQSSIILKETSVVTFDLNYYEGDILCYDHKHIKLGKVDKLICKNSDKIVKIARFNHYNYLKRLKNLF